ncbi:MAG: hypothetical protein M1823_004394 [Watsoniomyces obsoletus]|nr:MAG: hypothetical protein M1823_004394 [Watsoniomyces obsoletus]
MTMGERDLAVEENDHLRAANAAKKKWDLQGRHLLSKARVVSSQDLEVAREKVEKRKAQAEARKTRASKKKQWETELAPAEADSEEGEPE